MTRKSHAINEVDGMTGKQITRKSHAINEVDGTTVKP